MREKEYREIVSKFERIMGPVAKTLAKEAALEAGGIEEETDDFSFKNEGDYEKAVSLLKEKYARIIGAALVESMFRQ